MTGVIYVKVKDGSSRRRGGYSFTGVFSTLKLADVSPESLAAIKADDGLLVLDREPGTVSEEKRAASRTTKDLSAENAELRRSLAAVERELGQARMAYARASAGAASADQLAAARAEASEAHAAEVASLKAELAKALEANDALKASHAAQIDALTAPPKQDDAKKKG